MADFPISLSAPHNSSYSVAPDSAVIRTDFDSGPARQRQRFTAVPQKIDLVWRFSAAQMLVFRDFFKNTLHQGSDWFGMNLDIGDGFLPYTVRYTQPYRATIIARAWWEVTAQIEVQNA